MTPVTDVEAARAADVPVVGYANKPGKADRLQDAGADAIATDMRQVADAIRSAGPPVWPTGSRLSPDG